MINCNDALRAFSAYWEEELPAPRREHLESHWKICDHCRSEYESFVSAMRLVHDLPSLEAPADLTANVLRRVRAVEAAPPTSWWSPARLFDWAAGRADWGWRPVLSGAAAVLAVVAGFAVLQRAAVEAPSELPSGPAVALEPAAPAPSAAALPDAPQALPERTADAVSPPSPERSLATLPESEQSLGAPSAPSRSTSLAAGEKPLLAEAPGAAEVAGTRSSFLDSLLLHGAEVEYALDRIRLRNVPGDSGLTPMPAMPGAPEGKPASLTF